MTETKIKTSSGITISGEIRGGEIEVTELNKDDNNFVACVVGAFTGMAVIGFSIFLIANGHTTIANIIAIPGFVLVFASLIFTMEKKPRSFIKEVTTWIVK